MCKEHGYVSGRGKNHVYNLERDMFLGQVMDSR